MTIRLLAATSAALLLSLAWAFASLWPLPQPVAVVAPLGVIGLLLIGGLWWTLVLRPLVALKRALARLDAGDCKVALPERGTRELKRMAANFNALSERLQDRRREQQRFISHVVHDLRNPLHSITMASELLELKSPEDNGELVSAIFRQVSSLDLLLSELIDLSRIEAGELELRLAGEDVVALVRDAVETCRKGNDLHHFRIDTREECLFCRCDGRRIAYVLRNLLCNAVKYSPRGGEVRIRIRRHGPRVEIAVTDHGIGIAREEQENIFKPFYRVKMPGTAVPGKGLGLSTSRRIVEAHGGTISVESRVGKGATFRVQLPLARPVDENQPEA